MLVRSSQHVKIKWLLRGQICTLRPTVILVRAQASTAMSYFRRFRMEIDLRKASLVEPELPSSYRWVPWDNSLLIRHAAVKHTSFRMELDSQVFPSLGDSTGCKRLMNEIVNQRSFLPEATWLITCEDPQNFGPEDCGTIQGVRQSRSLGAIQNVGVVPAHRGLGLGRALVLQSLRGFRQRGLRRVYLEVTASNQPAVALYRSLGFRLTRTLYKVVDAAAVASP